MMMKAEMAREMTRSRSQMPMPELTRMDGAAMVAPGTATAGAIAASFVPPGPGSVSDMNLYSIQNRFQLLRVVSRLEFTGISSQIPDPQSSGYNNWTEGTYDSPDGPQDLISQPDFGIPFSG